MKFTAPAATTPGRVDSFASMPASKAWIAVTVGYEASGRSTVMVRMFSVPKAWIDGAHEHEALQHQARAGEQNKRQRDL